MAVFSQKYEREDSIILKERTPIIVCRLYEHYMRLGRHIDTNRQLGYYKIRNREGFENGYTKRCKSDISS